MKKHIPKILFLFIFCPLLVHAQSIITVTGKVYSASSKRPLEGINILSKLTGMALSSNKEGGFAISVVAQQDTLEFASIGYTTLKYPISNIKQDSIVVYLEELTLHIQEVLINTGYQFIPKERATGSFTRIDNELFNRGVSTDIISRLEGVTNGLLFEFPTTQEAPSSSPQLRLRGISTIRGEGAPLIVVDNFPYEGDINNINPNDVKDVVILKDAASASIWGARAGNGVIVVTTKRGARSERPKMTVNSNINIVERPDLYYFQRTLPADELVELERTLFHRGLYPKNDWTARTPVVEILYALDEGRINKETADRMLEDLKQFDIREDATKYLYRRGVDQQYVFNVSGGSDSHAYYLSSGVDNNKMSQVGNRFQRVSLNANNELQVLKKLSISSSFNYVQHRTVNNGLSITNLAPSGMNDIYTYARLVDDGGNILPIVKNNRYYYTDKAKEMGLLDWHFYPLDELRFNDNTSRTQEIRLNSSLRYALPFGLTTEARYQYQNIGNSVRNHYTEESYLARDLINQFTQEDGAMPIPVGGVLDKQNSMFSTHYGRIQFGYDNALRDRHTLNLVAGFELRQERLQNYGQSRLYGYNDNILTYATNLDFASAFPRRPRLSGRIPYGNTSGAEVTDRFVSYYGNFAYVLDSRYIVSASARWDASNIFGVDFNQKGVPLWSFGLAWNVVQETHSGISWISAAKIRATYGSSGNVMRSLSALPVMRYGSNNLITGLPKGNLSSIGNPDLRWEKVNTLNVGLDFSILKGRISGNFEWYSKNSSDLIGEDMLDPTTGIYFTGRNYSLSNRRNYANMRTSGIDIEVNSVNLDKEFKWHTTFIFNHVDNEITNFILQRNINVIDFLQGPIIPLVEGLPREQLYAIPWHGLDNTGSPLVMVNGELGNEYNAFFNQLERGDLLQVGVTSPPYFGGLRNTLRWRTLSVSFNVVWKAGFSFRRESINYNALLGPAQRTHIDYLYRWKQAGDQLTVMIPSMPETNNLRREQAYMFSEVLVERGDNIRLQDINLTYEVPQMLSGYIGLSQIKLYSYVRNLGVLWKKTDYDIDPNVNSRFPHPVQIAFGLQIQI